MTKPHDSLQGSTVRPRKGAGHCLIGGGGGGERPVFSGLPYNRHNRKLRSLLACESKKNYSNNWVVSCDLSSKFCYLGGDGGEGEAQTEQCTC